MSAELQTALVNEVLDLSNMFKQNCALKHGLPEVNNNRITKLDPPPKQEPPVVNVQVTPAATAANTALPSPGAGAAETVKQTLIGKAAPVLLAGAIGAAGPLAYTWFTGGGEAVKVEAAKQQQSLLDALQNQGFHLDPERGAQWQTP